MAEQARPWERHMQTILSSLVLAGVLWLANTANNTAQNVAVLEAKMAAIEGRFDDLKATMSDRFTNSQGQNLTERVDRIERRLEKLEGAR